MDGTSVGYYFSCLMDPHSTFRAILHELLWHLADAFIQNDLEHLSEESETIYRCHYIKDVHRI